LDLRLSDEERAAPKGAAAPPDIDTTGCPAAENNSAAGRRLVDTLLISLLRLTQEFGHPLSEADLRDTCPVPETGMTTSVFLMAAERLGINATRAPFTAANAEELPTPFVLLARSEVGAFVILGRGRNGYSAFRAVDGAMVQLSVAEALALGQQVLLAAPAIERSDWRQRAIAKVKGVAGELILASVIVNLFALASPLFVMTVYNKVIGQQALDTLVVLAIGMGIVYAFDLLLKAIRGYISSHTGARMDALIGGEAVHRLLHLPYRHFETTPTGMVAERVRQLETIRNFFTGQMPMLLVDLAFVAVFLAALYYLSPMIGHVIAASIPIFILISMGFHRAQKRLIEQNFKALAAKSSVLNETVANAVTVKALGLEGEIERRWGSRLALSAMTAFRANNLANIISSVGSVLQQMAGLAIIVFGAHLVIAGELSIGALIAANLLGSRAIAPMRQVVSAWDQLQEVRAAFRRLGEIMDEPIETEPGDRLPALAFGGEISFEHVKFSYGPEHGAAVEDLDLTIGRGEVICIMGPSGSGKSTLIKLALGLYQPESGRILIDGTDIAHVSPASLRRQIGVVPQEIQLFAGTVRDNIAIGVPGIDHERVVAAARLAGADEFIQRLPHGYDTVLAERGGGLSVGQRQLICIARALVRQPNMLIMDEPTGALDSASEAGLWRRLKALAGSMTIVIVSHRSAPAAIADRIAVLVDGKVVASGSPDQIARLTRGGRGLRPTMTAIQGGRAETAHAG
jgi:HlyB family type I secretion system ABC transporter